MQSWRACQGDTGKSKEKRTGQRARRELVEETTALGYPSELEKADTDFTWLFLKEPDPTPWLIQECRICEGGACPIP